MNRALQRYRGFLAFMAYCWCCTAFGVNLKGTPLPTTNDPTLSSRPSSQSTSVPVELKVPLPRSEYDISHQYYVGLLRLALQKAANGRDTPRLVTTVKVEQANSIQALAQQKLIDVFWVGTDHNKEQQLRAIKIPLERGLMGFRKFTIVRSMKTRLDQVHNLTDLKKLRACVGSDWPDRAILEHAGLPVLAVADYEQLFAQLAAGACDYFPRGLHEGKAELSLRAAHYPQLVRYQDIILHYPFAVYFFTSRDNEALAKWIEEGLEQLIRSGELLSYMQQHPLTRHIFPLSQFQAKDWITLENPIISDTNTMAMPRYWFLKVDFQ